MKSKFANYLLLALGLLLLVAGVCLVKTLALSGAVRAFPFVCIGLGCGLFGHGLGQVLTGWAVKKDPALETSLRIAETDERNVTLSNMAKGKAFDAMTILFSALILAFAMMEVEMVVVLLLVAAYLAVQGLALYYRSQLEKRM